MNIDIQQVGKRWFLSWGYLDQGRKELFNVEASYSHRTEYREENDWNPRTFRQWKLTGKGSEKYREEISTALDAFVDALELPKAIESTELPSETGAETEPHNPYKER